VIDEGLVYVFGAEGMLHCVRADDGKLVWKVDTAKRFGVVQNFFGVGSTPVVEGELLLVMIGGSVTICDEPLPLVGLHYSDHHTPFGPMSSGPYGLGIWALMPKSDPGGIYSHQPDYKDRLKPSKRRSVLVGSIALSTESVLQNRSAVAMDGLLPKDTDISDGLGAFMLRMGSKMKTTGPDPKLTGGQYYMVLNGSMNYNGASYPAWSNVFLDSAETPFEVCAGSRGLEALVMNFPRMEA